MLLNVAFPLRTICADCFAKKITFGYNDPVPIEIPFSKLKSSEQRQKDPVFHIGNIVKMRHGIKRFF